MERRSVTLALSPAWLVFGQPQDQCLLKAAIAASLAALCVASSMHSALGLGPVPLSPLHS